MIVKWRKQAEQEVTKQEGWQERFSYTVSATGSYITQLREIGTVLLYGPMT